MRIEKILLLGYDPFVNILISGIIRAHDDWNQSQITVIDALEKAVRELSITDYQLILLDCDSFEISPLEMLIQLRGANKKIPIILLNEPGKERTAIQCLKHGANYYLVKEDKWEEELPAVMEIVCEEFNQGQKTHQRISALEEEVKNLRHFSALDNSTQFYRGDYFKSLMARELNRANRHSLDLTCLVLDITKEGKEAHPNDADYSRMALLLRSIVRSSDIWARLDANRFAALLPHTSSKQAKIAIKRITSEIKNEEALDDPQTSASVKLRWGMAQFDKKKIKNEEEFLQKAMAQVA